MRKEGALLRPAELSPLNPTKSKTLTRGEQEINRFNQCLIIAKLMGDRAEEGRVYNNLGIVWGNLGDVQKAIDYHNLQLNIARELKDKAGEGHAYGNLGNDFLALGDLKKSVEYHLLDLAIAEEVENTIGKGRAYGNLGICFHNLGDFIKAEHYHKLHLNIAKKMGDKAGEGRAYANLGCALQARGNFTKAIEYHNRDLKIAKELSDKAGEGAAYGNLGHAFHCLGDYKRAIDNNNLHLAIAKEVGDKAGEGKAYDNLGNAFRSLGDFKKAIHYHTLRLNIAKASSDKIGLGHAYANLGNAFRNLGDFKKAIDYYKLHLEITQEVEDKMGEGRAYGNLGLAFYSLGDFKKARDFHSLHLKFAERVGDKAAKGGAYGNLGSVFFSLGDYKKAIDYHKLHLKIAGEVGDKAGQGTAYGNLGNAFHNLGDVQNAIVYHTLSLSIAKEVGDKAGEGVSYGNLGLAFGKLGNYNKAIDYYKLDLEIAKEVEDKAREALAYDGLGVSFESLGRLPEALEYYQSSVRSFNHVRSLLKSKDEWKIGFRDVFNNSYKALWRVLLKQDKITEALFAAEKGRAQALTDLMESQFGIQANQGESSTETEKHELDMSQYVSSCSVFQALDKKKINLWVLLKGKPVCLRQKEIAHGLQDTAAYFRSIVQTSYKQVGVRSEVRCEDRSLDALRKYDHTEDVKFEDESSQPSIPLESLLNTLYNNIIEPVADLVQGNELIIVPDGPLWLAPYAALMDADSKYLCDSFRIRVVPSLTSLKLIADCSKEYHSRSGSLLVGDPWVEEVTNSKGERILDPLPFARKEVEMIGRILNVTPITGKQATKREVLKELSSVALVHFAAHGRMETGEIALTPDPKRRSRIPTKEDYILTIADVLNVKLRARLVVLSCCHSGRGEIKDEGVVGIARAFMGAGARSALVSLWAIDDEATLKFMESFYHHLIEGRRASESLNLAMKNLRESDKYSDVKYWAPFVLIGDDVTLDFDQKK